MSVGSVRDSAPCRMSKASDVEEATEQIWGRRAGGWGGGGGGSGLWCGMGVKGHLGLMCCRPG